MLSVLQVVLSGVHVPPLPQFPLQQVAELEQVWLSATQLVAVEQTLRDVSHCRLQQSVATAHEPPGPLQVATEDVHFDVVGSQVFEQHWPSDVQAAPGTVQMTPEPPVAVPPEPALPPEPTAPPAAPLLPPAPAAARLDPPPQPGISRKPTTSRAAIQMIVM